LLGLALIGVAFFGLSRVPTAFIPLEDQGYLIVNAQLPDAASLERTQRVMEKVTNVAKAIPGVDQVVAISGISVLDNSASLPNAGVAYVVLKSWDERYKAKGQDLITLFKTLRTALQDEILEANTTVIPPPPIQGIGNSGGFTMEVEVRDGSVDFAKLQSVATEIVNNAKSQSAVQAVFSPFRASAPQLQATIDRNKAETLGVTVGQVFQALGSYIGSTYVGQINKFGRVFQVYVQSESQFRTNPGDIAGFKIKTPNGQMVPLGTLLQVQRVTGPSLITLYNLYPAATIAGTSSPQFSSGETMGLMEQIAAKTLPPGTSFNWTAMSYQEKVTGNQIYYVFALAILLVYLVLAGQYESLALPLAVILSVPLALLGTVGALTALGVANNLYTQIGLILLIALSSKNAILIVEYARDLRTNGATIIESAVEAARLRFRPILMTSFAFILGVLPLVLATGAGASARKSIGVAVFSGMLGLHMPRRALRAVLLRCAEALRGMEAIAQGGPKAEGRSRTLFAGLGHRACNRTRATWFILYTTCVWRPVFVILFLTLSSAFLLLQDCQRNRFDGRLTQLIRAPSLIIRGKRTEQDAIAAACAAAVWAARVVNSRVRNIFNGFYPAALFRTWRSKNARSGAKSDRK